MAEQVSYAASLIDIDKTVLDSLRWYNFKNISASTPTLMPNYSLFPIAKPVPSSQLTAYKTLRLNSLRVDPGAFDPAAYAKESAYPDDYWEAYLNSPFRQTFVAFVQDASQDSRIITAGDQTGEWVGTATIAGPSVISPLHMASLKEDRATANWEVYMLRCVWIDPAHRRHGVATQLIKACLEWVPTHVDTRFASENGGDFDKVVALLISHHNAAARALYLNMGFSVLKSVPWPGVDWPGVDWLSINV